MNYTKLIEGRTSSRAFKDKPVSGKIVDELLFFYEKNCKRLLPDIQTDLIITGTDAKTRLEKAAGYNEFLVGAPQYLVLLSEDKPNALINAGFMMEDLALKLKDLSCGACFITFADGEKIKEALSIRSEKCVAAILAFGLDQPVRKKIHVNIITMSNVIVKGGRQYFAPKKSVRELTYLNTCGNRSGLKDHLETFGDSLAEPLHAASLAPSYMNCQPYSFLIKENKVFLLSEQNELTPETDRDLGLGVVMLHFAAVAEDHIGRTEWKFADYGLELPEGITAVAACEI